MIRWREPGSPLAAPVAWATTRRWVHPDGLWWPVVHRCDTRGYHCSMVKARTTVGRKGRTVIPVAARQAAGIEEGQELVVLADAPGRLVLMTREAIQGEVWRAAADMRSDTDAIADLRAMRREDITIADAAEERTRRRGAETAAGRIDAVGIELLRHLGVDSAS